MEIIYVCNISGTLQEMIVQGGCQEKSTCQKIICIKIVPLHILPPLRVITWLEPAIQSKTSAVNIKNKQPLGALNLSEPMIWSDDTGQWIPCFESCQLVTTWISNIKDVPMVMVQLIYLSRYWAWCMDIHTDVCLDSHVTAKILEIDGLPRNVVRYGALLALLQLELRYYKQWNRFFFCVPECHRVTSSPSLKI